MFDELHNEIHTYISQGGYAWYNFKINNKRKSTFIHRLVYELFCGVIPQGMQVHHKDRNRLNNSIENLELKEFKQHQSEHSQKYFDKEMICPICGKTFLWTAKQQRRHFEKRFKHSFKQPICSKRCVGVYGQRQQILKSKNAKIVLIVYKENELLFDNICYDEFSTYLQNKFAINKYRANEAINRCLKGERKSYHNLTIKEIKNN